MLKIRLSRTGRKNLASFRIVVTNLRDKRDGKSLDIIGVYNPRSEIDKVVIDKDKAKAWLGKGAQPTDTVKTLFIKNNILPKNRKNKKFNDKPGKKTQTRSQKKEDKTAPVDSK